jgi:hypothetical protein
MERVEKCPPVPPTLFSVKRRLFSGPSGLLCRRLGPCGKPRVRGCLPCDHPCEFSLPVRCCLASVPPAAQFRGDCRRQYGHDRYRDHHSPYSEPHAKQLHGRSSRGSTGNCRLYTRLCIRRSTISPRADGPRPPAVDREPTRAATRGACHPPGPARRSPAHRC